MNDGNLTGVRPMTRRIRQTPRRETEMTIMDRVDGFIPEAVIRTIADASGRQAGGVERIARAIGEMDRTVTAQ